MLVLVITAGFVLFRILDITKPPPIRGIQSVHGGIGILVDDLAAGLIAGDLPGGAPNCCCRRPHH